MPRASIVVAALPGSKWLDEAVRSAREQTFRDVEILVTLPRGTAHAGAGFDHRRIRYVEFDGRPSLSAARNVGVRMADGEYLAFLDADDLFLPTKLERQIAYMDEHPGAALTYTSYQRMSEGGEFLHEVRAGAVPAPSFPEILLACPIVTSTVLVRRDSIGIEPRFDESIDGGEDVLLWAKLAQQSELLGLDECLTSIRMNGTSFCRDPRRSLRVMVNVMNSPLALGSPLSSAIRRRTLSRIFGDVSEELWRYVDEVELWPLNVSDEIADRNAIIRDLQWALEQEVRRRDAATDIRIQDEILSKDLVIGGLHAKLAQVAARANAEMAHLHMEVAARDETITWLHGEVAERDETVAWLHEEVARRDETIERLRREVAEP